MKDYGNGYSIEELAAKYRLSVRTCYRALDDAKQKARIQLAQVEDARKAEILAAYKNSVPLKEMIAKFNVACQQPRLNRFAGYRRGLRGNP